MLITSDSASLHCQRSHSLFLQHGFHLVLAPGQLQMHGLSHRRRVK